LFFFGLDVFHYSREDLSVTLFHFFLLFDRHSETFLSTTFPDNLE
jgi:hypothetical protein